mmetsp:Transcript_3957/g.11683  ORF Transcript_3957/g.11683 Transcript_3957/m.11683 type:complete len:926 (+) Transcript_3957:247-3024(+)
MTPPNQQHSAEHYAVIAQIESLGYEVITTDRFPCCLCGDIQSRDRWIMIGRRKLANATLPKFCITSKLRHTPRPLSEILEHPTDIAPGSWTICSTEPYVRPMQSPAKYEFSGGTLISNYENAELELLLTRLCNENLPQAQEDGYLTIGPYASRDLMTNPLVAKAYSLIYNIMQRTSGKCHNIYLIDIFENRTTLEAAFKLKQPSDRLTDVATFTVGFFSGANLVRKRSLKGVYHETASVSTLDQINTCQSVFFPSNGKTITETKHKGTCFRITTVASHQRHSGVRDYLIKLANSYVPYTIVLEESGLLNFLDPKYTIETKHLTRAGYIGHIHAGTEKGCKVYSIHRPCPTYTKYHNVLIWDNRTSHHCGVRNLTLTEAIRLNNFPPEIESYLYSIEPSMAYQYIANSIPAGTLHTIYNAIIGDLDRRELHSGGDYGSSDQLSSKFCGQPWGNPSDQPSGKLFGQSSDDAINTITSDTITSDSTISSCYNSVLYTMSCQQPQASLVDQYIMANLFTTIDLSLDDIDIDVSKKKETPPVKLKVTEEKDPNDTAERSRRRMANWLRTFHASKDRAKRSMECTHGHGLKRHDLQNEIECMEDLIYKYDAAPPRTRFNPRGSRLFDQYQTGEVWSLDGVSIGHESVHGHKYAITFVELYSKKPVAYYTRTNRSTEFKDAVEYLRFFVRTKCNRDVRVLCSDMFTSYMQFVGEDSIAEYRKYHGIELRVAPPYTHSRNSFAEKINQIGRRGTRARLSQLAGKGVGPNNVIITEPLSYWPFAWEHTMQCEGHLPAISPEKKWHHVATCNQWLTHNFTVEQVNMKPFGELCIVQLEPDERPDRKRGAQSVRALYLMSGELNSLRNKFADMPECHIVLTNKHQFKTVFAPKCKFPFERGTHLSEGTEITQIVPDEPPEQVDLETDEFEARGIDR